MSIKITDYDAICNLGENIKDIYKNVLEGNNKNFIITDKYIKNKKIRIGVVNSNLPKIEDRQFNLRCNRLILKLLLNMNKSINRLFEKYPKNRIGVVVATTNSGVEEFEKTSNISHCEIGNPAEFIKTYLGLNSYFSTVSTACSSGLKTFSLARDLLNKNISDAVIVVSVDSIAKVALFGFESLEVLSNKPSIPFSKNREGMNIGEGCALFILEKSENFNDDNERGINILGVGESTGIYHSTTPNPEADEEILAIKEALDDANLSPQDIDYINLHGTGTLANDLMEGNAVYKVFGDNKPVSSTKQMTGHCLGAGAGIETALCCMLLENFNGQLFPHIYDGEYDESISKVKLVDKNTNEYECCNICMCNSFGFGGTNAILILSKK